MRRVGAAGKESYRRKLSAISRALDFLGQKEVVTAAHNACIRELLQEIDVHGKEDRYIKILTLERENSLGTLWDQDQCAQFCSKDELWEAVKEEEMKIPWKEVHEGLSV